jgi:hypothetical protein
MMTVAEIETAIRKLPREKLAALRKWFASFDAKQWDRQIEEDVARPPRKVGQEGIDRFPGTQVHKPVTIEQTETKTF